MPKQHEILIATLHLAVRRQAVACYSRLFRPATTATPTPTPTPTATATPTPTTTATATTTATTTPTAAYIFASIRALLYDAKRFYGCCRNIQIVRQCLCVFPRLVTKRASLVNNGRVR